MHARTRFQLTQWRLKQISRGVQSLLMTTCGMALIVTAAAMLQPTHSIAKAGPSARTSQARSLDAHPEVSDAQSSRNAGFSEDRREAAIPLRYEHDSADGAEDALMP